MLEIESGDVSSSDPEIYLTLKNIKFNDNFLSVGSIFNYRNSADSSLCVQDAIVASHSPHATIVLGDGAELWNYGGMTVVCAFYGSTVVMESGSLIAETSDAAAKRELSTTTTDYRARSEAAVSIARGTTTLPSGFYMYDGAVISNIANTHSVKLTGTYKCFIDGEITGMKGNKGWDATDHSTLSNNEGRGPKNAVYFDSFGTTLDTGMGVPGDYAIIGPNANIHHNAVKCGAICVSRSVGVSVKIYGKINDNSG
jgi:hypothetical protein